MHTGVLFELVEQHSEQELERALIARIEDLPGQWAACRLHAQPYRLEVDGEACFIYLLLLITGSSAVIQAFIPMPRLRTLV